MIRNMTVQLSIDDFKRMVRLAKDNAHDFSASDYDEDVANNFEDKMGALKMLILSLQSAKSVFIQSSEAPCPD